MLKPVFLIWVIPKDLIFKLPSSNVDLLLKNGLIFSRVIESYFDERESLKTKITVLHLQAFLEDRV